MSLKQNILLGTISHVHQEELPLVHHNSCPPRRTSSLASQVMSPKKYFLLGAQVMSPKNIFLSRLYRTTHVPPGVSFFGWTSQWQKQAQDWKFSRSHVLIVILMLWPKTKNSLLPTMQPLQFPNKFWQLLNKYMAVVLVLSLSCTIEPKLTKSTDFSPEHFLTT